MTIYNRAHLLERTLDALVRQGLPKQSWELVIVDDQSTDGLEDLLRRMGEKIQIIHVVMDREKSVVPCFANCPALGLNLAMTEAHGEIIYKTDPEVLPVTPTLKQTMDCFRADRFYFGRVYDVTEDAQKLVEAGELVPMTDLQELVGYSVQMPYYFIGIFSRSLAMRIGGVEERFMAGVAGEDDDFAIRMQYAGAMWAWHHGMIGLHQYHGPPWYKKPGIGMGSAPHQKNVRILKETLASIGEYTYPYSNVPRQYEGDQTERIEKVRANKDLEWASPKAVVDTHTHG